MSLFAGRSSSPLKSPLQSKPGYFCMEKPSVRVDLDDLDQLSLLVQECVPGCSNSVVTGMSPLSGGYTNKLYDLHLENLPTSVFGVLLRIYGEGTGEFIDRNAEINCANGLHAAGLAPRYYVAMENGRLEQKLNSTALQPEDLREGTTSKEIARLLKRLHSQQGPETASTVWDAAAGWLAKAATAKAADSSRQKEIDELDVAQLSKMLTQMQIEICPKQGNLCLCHNDLLHGNILRNLDDGSLSFVDFEYSGLNPAAFDIANHFNEWQSMDDQNKGIFDFYPSSGQAENFFRGYLGDDATEVQLQELQVMVGVFSLVSHLYWGSWSILQAQATSIDFDYVEFAKQRIGQFRKHFDARMALFRAWTNSNQ